MLSKAENVPINKPSRIKKQPKYPDLLLQSSDDAKIAIRCIRWHGNNVPKDIKTFQKEGTDWNYPWELDEWFLDLPESEMPQNENDLQDPQVWMDAVCEKFKVDIKMDIDEIHWNDETVTKENFFD